MKEDIKSMYCITVLVRYLDMHDEHEDRYPVIAKIETFEESIDFAKKTVGTVEIIGTVYNDKNKCWDETGELIGFLDGEQQYHDNG